MRILIVTDALERSSLRTTLRVISAADTPAAPHIRITPDMLRHSLGGALLLLGVISCSGGGEGPTGTTPVAPNAPTVRLLADTARVGSVLMLDIEGSTSSGDTVSARIGTTPVRLVRTTATGTVFRMALRTPAPNAQTRRREAVDGAGE